MSMQIISSSENPGIIFDLFRNTKQDDFNYFYRGNFTQSITDNILTLAEKNIEETTDPSKIKRRVYFLMVESLQNITRYQAINVKTDDTDGMFVIQKKGNRYLITTGNLIHNHRIEYVKAQLERVNSFDREELKDYYRKILSNKRFTNEGGAGLGLIEMVRKSGNKLSFHFDYINEDCSFFYLHTIITPKGYELKTEIDLNNSIKATVELHKEFKKLNTLMVFNSGFSKEGLMNMLSIMEKQVLTSGEQGKKVYNITLEMLENIIHHGSNIGEDHVVKPGIFYIREKSEDYILNAGNYILNSNVDSFKEKLVELNALSIKELDEVYMERLEEQKLEPSKEAGLGILDMHLKSSNDMIFRFCDINEKLSFFTIQVTVGKS